MEGFHYKDGIYATRLEDGSVKITIKESAHMDAETVKEIIFDPDGWCSIIATVSYRDETPESWIDANKFHMNKKGA